MTGEPLVRRSDDNEATLRRRLDAYHAQTSPLVDYYKQRNLHSYIDASQAMSSVFAAVSAIFDGAREKRATQAQ